MATFRTADEVKRVAKKLIGAHHTHLHGIDIKYVFRDKATKDRGKVIAGTATVKKGVDAMIAAGSTDSTGLFYGLITIAEDVWEKMTKAEREYLVDHELAHLGIDNDAKTGARKLVTLPHEIEEFGAVIGRHGIQPATATFLEKFDHEQLRLFANNL